MLFVLAFGWGLCGVAAGTLVPTVLLGATATAVITRRHVGLPFQAILRDLLLPAVLTGVVFATLCLLVRRVVDIAGWPTFFAAVGALSAAYVPLALGLMLNLLLERRASRRMTAAYNAREE